MASRFTALCFFSALSACSVSTTPPPAPARVDRAIIGGTPDADDPAVVLLISYPPDESSIFTCTASFVAPTLLVTAAHCVNESAHPSFTFGVFLGPDANAYSDVASLAPKLVGVKEVHAHPNYNPLSPFDADIGVVVLNEAQSIVPLPYQKSALTSSIVSQPARLVGYGQTIYGVFNDAKYQAATSVAALDSGDTVSVGDSGHHSCVGDSGGPALVVMNGVETMIGVDSYTDDPGCSEPSHYRRVDLYQAFIEQYLPAPNADLSIVPRDFSIPPYDMSVSAHSGASGCALGGSGAPTSLLSIVILIGLFLRRSRNGDA